MSINFWGVVYGTKAFLPHLRASGEGHVINISSIFGIIACPAAAPTTRRSSRCAASPRPCAKSSSSRAPCVSATCVHPGGIKTNIARDSRISANMNGFLVKDADSGRADFEKMFITTPRQAANTILKAVKKNQRRVLVGPDATALDLFQRFLPSTYQALTISRRFVVEACDGS